MEKLGDFVGEYARNADSVVNAVDAANEELNELEAALRAIDDELTE